MPSAQILMNTLYIFCSYTSGLTDTNTRKIQLTAERHIWARKKQAISPAERNVTQFPQKSKSSHREVCNMQYISKVLLGTSIMMQNYRYSLIKIKKKQTNKKRIRAKSRQYNQTCNLKLIEQFSRSLSRCKCSWHLETLPPSSCSFNSHK